MHSWPVQPRVAAKQAPCSVCHLASGHTWPSLVLTVVVPSAAVVEVMVWVCSSHRKHAVGVQSRWEPPGALSSAGLVLVPATSRLVGSLA
jgi:hypothetical protein